MTRRESLRTVSRSAEPATKSDIAAGKARSSRAVNKASEMARNSRKVQDAGATNGNENDVSFAEIEKKIFENVQSVKPKSARSSSTNSDVKNKDSNKKEIDKIKGKRGLEIGRKSISERNSKSADNSQKYDKNKQNCDLKGTESRTTRSSIEMNTSRTSNKETKKTRLSVSAPQPSKAVTGLRGSSNSAETSSREKLNDNNVRNKDPKSKLDQNKQKSESSNKSSSSSKISDTSQKNSKTSNRSLTNNIPQNGLSKAAKDTKGNASEPSTSKRSNKKKDISNISDKHHKRSSSSSSTSKKAALKSVRRSASDSELSDWEDVAEGHQQGGHTQDWNVADEAEALGILTKKSTNTNTADSDKQEEPSTSGVQIELEAPQLWGTKRRREKKSDEYWMMVHLRREVNQEIRENYINCHKVHLLLLLGHGQYLNRILNSQDLLAAALSIVTNKDVYPPKRVHLVYLEQLARWFIKKVPLVNEPLEKFYWAIPVQRMLEQRFEKRQARTPRELVLMFVLVGRALGMSVRLVQSLSPLPWKPSMDALFKAEKIDDEDMKIDDEHLPPKEKKDSCVSDKKRNLMVSNDSDDSPVDKSKVKKASPTKKRKKVTKQYSSDESEDMGQEYDEDSDFEITVKKKNKRISKSSGSGRSKDINGSKSSSTSSKGSDSSKGKRSLSADSAPKSTSSKKKRSDACAEWAEVYVEEEERWMCVDVVKGKIHCTAELMSRAPPPVAYVTAFNPDQSVKDVTKRYISTWLAYENKLRCDSDWWKRVLSPYAPAFSKRDRAEDKLLDQGLRQQPLPKTVAEYKNHPMYALQRHLLKFEALYPPNPDPVGFFKSEPVYPRDCVYTLHSRDIWLKQAKTVIVGEEPYKIVKARPKWDRVNCRMITDLPLEVFGPWQVEDYKPPVAKDGKVPRNAYGNVELFKASMLPVGCVHLNSSYEDISRVARKLKIDCASAMVGFDFHKGGTHPVFDGYVVCTENRDLLVDAWKEEMQLKAKREEDKRVKRIYGNWKRLIHGLLVRRHVRDQYGGSEDSLEEEQSSKKAKGDGPNTKNEATGKATKNKPTRKVKQADIDAARPENSKKEKVLLGIDLTSNTVAMAKKSFKDSIKSRGIVHSDDELNQIVPKKEDLILDSDEEIHETEEEKKENIKKILAWTDSKLEASTCLSDASDAEDNTADSAGNSRRDASSSSSRAGDKKTKSKGLAGKTKKSKNSMLSSDSSDFETTGAGPGNNLIALITGWTNRTDKKQSTTAGEKKKKTTMKRPSKTEIDITPVTSDDEYDVAGPSTATGRRRRRTAAAVTYQESEPSDISLGESDFEDKSYMPPDLLKQKKMIKVDDELALSEESD